MLDDKLFVADGGGLSVYDATKPDTLVFSWFVNTNQFGDGLSVFATPDLVALTVYTSGLYLIDHASQGVSGILSVPDIGLGVVANDRNAFSTDEVNGLIAVDITNPANPVALDSLSGSVELGGGLALANDFVYWCAGQNGLKVVDISQPSKLQEKASFAPSQIFAIRAALTDTLIFLATGDLPETGGFKNGVYILKNELVTSVASQESTAPDDFVLAQNYPNPFNPETTIRYTLPQGSEVNLSVYNLLGQRITTLVDRKQTRGSHHISWNGRDQKGLRVSSGLYIYELQAGGFTLVRRMLLLR